MTVFMTVIIVNTILNNKSVVIFTEMSAPESLNKTHVEVLKTIPDAWMLRECHCYHEEAKSCKSLKGRFYQYYIHGEMKDCSEWTANHEDCKVSECKLATDQIRCSCLFVVMDKQCRQGGGGENHRQGEGENQDEVERSCGE